MLLRQLSLYLTCLVLLASPLIAQNSDEASPIATQVAESEVAIEAILAVPDSERTFENTVGAIDALVARFFADARPITFMKDVAPDAEDRAVGRAGSLAMEEWSIDLGRHEGLYQAVRAFADTKQELAPVQQRLLDITLRDFRREGMALSSEKRAALTEIDKELSELSLDFATNIAEDRTELLMTKAELHGLDDDFLATLERVGELHVIDMKGPTISPIFESCDVSDTRLKVSLAYSRRAPDNVDLLEKILLLRSEKASILGYPSIAHYVTETRMSKSPETVMAFYEDLRPKLRRKAEIDLQELSEAKRTALGDPTAVFEPQDFTFYKTWLMREKYAVDSKVLRDYFSLDKVTEGLFSITQSIYGVQYEEITDEAEARVGLAAWHPDVKLFEVTDVASSEVLGHFFIDLHPRDGKFSHAAQFPLRLRREFADGTVMTPLVSLVCNFTEPTESKPALLSHREVTTYFHEFGHCLHSIFTESPYANFSGTQVARDFVEAPSQMFENWVWDKEVLGTFAEHYETGAPLPGEVIDGMLAAKYLASGLSAEGQVFLGMMDMAFHMDADGIVDTTKVRQEVYEQTRLFPVTPGLYSQASFGHLMGYHAGYYGYLWSLVFASDMASVFESEGMLSPEAGMRYRKTVLARGGTMDELDVLREYLGREPKPDAFLVHLGLGKE